MDQHSPLGTPVKAQSSPNVRLGSGSVSPASTGKTTSEKRAPRRRRNSAGQNQRTLASWLKPSKSSGLIEMNQMTDTATDMGKAMAAETNRDLKAATGRDEITEIETTSRPETERLSHMKRPDLIQGVRAPSDLPKIAFSTPTSTATAVSNQCSAPQSVRTAQLPKDTGGLLGVVPKGSAASPKLQGLEVALSTDLPDLNNFDSEPSSLHGAEAAPPSGISDLKAIAEALPLNDSACGDTARSSLSKACKTDEEPLQPGTPVRHVEGDRSQSVGAIGAEKQGHRPFATDRLSSPPSPDFYRSKSAPSTSPSWGWIPAAVRKDMWKAFFRIAEVLRQDIKRSETWHGCIYAFKAKDDPQGSDYVKIGVTASVEDRMKEHKICYGVCELIFPPKDEQLVLFEHAKRVERLIHAELVEQALQVACPKGLHRSHGEWFHVDGKHAIAVIRKWCEWMRSSPYEERPIHPNTPTGGQKSPRAANELEEPPQTPSRTPPQTPPVTTPATTPRKTPRRTQREAPTTYWRLKPVEPSFIMEIWPLKTVPAKHLVKALD